MGNLFQKDKTSLLLGMGGLLVLLSQLKHLLNKS